MIRKIFKSKHVIVYAAALALLVFILKWLEYRFIVLEHSLEIYITLIALIFTGLGTWLAVRLVKPKTETKIETIIVEKEVIRPSENDEFLLDEAEKSRLGLSNREMEVLHLMAQGCSNQEIAEKLFVSLNTIKTHSSRLFEKLDVKRRTQAVEKAKRLRLIG